MYWCLSEIPARPSSPHRYARLRAWSGPDTLKTDAVVPLGQDPFAFVLGRGVPFYATDFSRLLHELPYYKPGTKLGTLLAVPVRVSEVVSAVLIADRAEIQAFTGDEPEILESFGALTADAVVQTRTAVGREEEGLEFHAVYKVSEKLAQAFEPITLWETFLRHVSDLVDFNGAAFVMTDERQTHYKVVAAQGWAPEFQDRVVGLTERTWTAWVLRGREESLPRTRTSSCDPMRIRSPSSRRLGSVTRSPLTQTPLALPRSAMAAPSPSTVSSAWRRDTRASSKVSAQLACRPMVKLPEPSGMVLPPKRSQWRTLEAPESVVSDPSCISTPVWPLGQGYRTVSRGARACRCGPRSRRSSELGTVRARGTRRRADLRSLPS